jgi:peptidoglycan/LPS O-acetylase OafA/YrhL
MGTHEPHRVKALDGIRGLACLLVLIWHYSNGRVPLAWSGVDLFFVLSGFLLGGILLDHRESPNLFRSFYLRRAVRIFPLYYAWLAAFIVLGHFLASADFARLFREPFSLGWYAVYAQNLPMAWEDRFGPPWLAVTWSLAVEEQFYLVLPAVVRWASPRILPVVLSAFVLSAPFSRLAFVYALDGGDLSRYVLLPCRWDSLFLGVLGAWLVRSPYRVTSGRLGVAAGVLFAGMVALAWHGAGTFGRAMTSVGYTWIACFYLSLIVLADHGGFVGRVLSYLPLCRLGTISYGVYLMHNTMASLLLGVMGSLESAEAVAALALSFGLTVALASLSYRYFEAPILRMGQRVYYADPASPPAIR